MRRIAFGIFLLLIFSLGFMKPSVETGFASLTPTDVIFPLAFVCWIAALLIGDDGFKWRTEFWALGVYFLALLVSCIFSINPRLSFIKLAGAAYMIMLAAMASSMVTTRQRLRLSVVAWLAGAVIPLIAAFVGIVLFYFAPQSSLLPDLTYHYGAVPVGNFPRISSTFVSASMFCNYLSVTFMFTVIAVKTGWIGKAVAAVIVFAIAVSAAFTVSIALGGVALAVGLWLLTTSPNKTIGRITSIVYGAIAIAFLAIAPFSISLLPEIAASSRVLVWRDALNTLLADPLTGNGLGAPVANVMFQNSDGTMSLLTDAHNTFLNVAAQAGILGLISIIAIVVVVLRKGFAKTEGSDFYILRGLAIAFVAAFVYDGMIGSFEDARHLWVLIGLILAANRIATDGDRSATLHSA
jgi:O-antigen ligase